MSSFSFSPTGNAKVDDNFRLAAQKLNQVLDSVNAKQQSVGYGYQGKEGDTQISADIENNIHFNIYTRNSWYTSFNECFQPKNSTGLSTLYLKNLEVDNLYAKIFTVSQTQSFNGNILMGAGSGIVDYVLGTVIYFKDQTNLNVCGFAVDDKCEIRSVNVGTGLQIRLVQFTVNSVSGRSVTVTYTGAGRPVAGDIAVVKGNSSTAARQNSIYFSLNDTNSPYIDVYSGTTGFTFGTPKVRVGQLTGITDSDFGGALTGYGIYTTNAYFKGAVKLTNAGSINISGFNNDAGYITSATIGNKSFYSATAPTVIGDNLVVGDFWFDTSGASYVMKRCKTITPSVTWDIISVYMNGSGVYAGNITAGQVTAGTFTGFTFQTDASGHSRVAMLAENDIIEFYNSTDAYPTGSITLFGSYGDGGTYGIQVGANLYVPTTIYMGGISTNGTVATHGYVAGLNVSHFANDVSYVVTGDSRLSNSRSASDVYSWAKASSKPSYTYSEVGAAAASHTHSSSDITDFTTAVNSVGSNSITDWMSSVNTVTFEDKYGNSHTVYTP
jgi:hypothetical protein